MSISLTPVCTRKGHMHVIGNRQDFKPEDVQHGGIGNFDLTGLFTPAYPDQESSRVWYSFPRDIQRDFYFLELHQIFETGNPMAGTEIIFLIDETHGERDDSYNEDLDVPFSGSPVYVIKVRNTSDNDVEDLAFENKLKLKHPNIVKVFYSGKTEDGKSFGVMDFVDGISLDQAIKLIHSPVLNPDKRVRRRRRPEDALVSPIRNRKCGSLVDQGAHSSIKQYVDTLPLYFNREELIALREQLRNEILKSTKSMAEALMYVGSEGVVHRDIKPQNILLSYDDEVKPHIIDLGACAHPYTEKKLLTPVGTVGYQAPELIEGGEVNSHTDMFSFGAVLYKILTGKAPFASSYDSAQALLRNAESLGDARNLISSALDKSIDSRLTFPEFIERHSEILVA